MTCLICGERSLHEILDLGEMPLVNNLLNDPHEDSPRWPLRIAFCPNCTLLQLTEAPPPKLLFDDYCYFSSQSQTMVAHARQLVSRHVRPGLRVVEIASNDGYLLRPAKERGAAVLGIDPAANIAKFANESGIPTRCAYFDRTVALEIHESFGAADVIFANNVLAHVADLHEFVEGVRVLLAPRGVAHIEVPWVVRIIETGAFDTIYHEHRCYFTVAALEGLFAAHRLMIASCEEVPIHGGSLHVQITHAGVGAECSLFQRKEQVAGAFDVDFYRVFASRIERLRASLLETLDAFESVAGYGAAAKAVVMLNHFGLDAKRVPWVADVSPYKQGRFIPGTGQPIVPPERLIEAKPDACIMFPWNLRDEIVGRNREYLDAGGRFIVPLPKVCVL